jgi:hypothetical protein
MALSHSTQPILWLDDDNKPRQISDHHPCSMDVRPPLVLEDMPRLGWEAKITTSRGRAQTATSLHQRGCGGQALAGPISPLSLRA